MVNVAVDDINNKATFEGRLAAVKFCLPDKTMKGGNLWAVRVYDWLGTFVKGADT